MSRAAAVLPWQWSLTDWLSHLTGPGRLRRRGAIVVMLVLHYGFKFIKYFDSSNMFCGSMSQGLAKLCLKVADSASKLSLFSYFNFNFNLFSVIKSPCPCVCVFVCLCVCARHQVEFFLRTLIGSEIT